MRYIGNKRLLLEDIHNILEKYNIKGDSFADIFAGTNSVGLFFKEKGYKIISNDIQYYSYVMAKAFIENNQKPSFKKLNMNIQEVITYLNKLEGIKGFIYENYSPEGTENSEYQRMYFTNENAKKLDAVRTEIEKWFDNNCIDENEYYYLLAILLKAMDRVSNTTSVYAAFLKKFQQSALNTLTLKEMDVFNNFQKNECMNEDVNKAIQSINADIIYLDPPYNNRQYASNYHLLETMAKYDNPLIYGKTGLRNYQEQKSKYSQKSNIIETFTKLIRDINEDSKYIVLSYNNEGLLSKEQILSVLSQKGHTICEEIEYKRFKSDNDNNRRYSANEVIEYVFITRIGQFN